MGGNERIIMSEKAKALLDALSNVLPEEKHKKLLDAWSTWNKSTSLTDAERERFAIRAMLGVAYDWHAYGN
jgi:hypothetical protein